MRREPQQHLRRANVGLPSSAPTYIIVIASCLYRRSRYRPQSMNRRNVVDLLCLRRRACLNSSFVGMALGHPGRFTFPTYGLRAKNWFDEDDTNKLNEPRNSRERNGREVAPIIDWNRDSPKDRQPTLIETTKPGKRRPSNWVSGFVTGRDDKADKAKLDARRITLPTTVSTKRK